MTPDEVLAPLEPRWAECGCCKVVDSVALRHLAILHAAMLSDAESSVAGIDPMDADTNGTGVDVMAEFRDTLDDEIAASMTDPEYAAAWVADLTPSQRRVLSVISRVNVNEGTREGWVDQLTEKLDKNSLYALERRGFVVYDRQHGQVRMQTAFVGLATACRVEWEGQL